MRLHSTTDIGSNPSGNISRRNLPHPLRSGILKTAKPNTSRTRGFHAGSQRPRRGAILIAVLGLIALVSFIVLEFIEEATDKIRYFGLFNNRDDLRTEAYSMLETTLSVIDELAEIDRGLYSPVQGWRDPLQYAQVEIPPGLNVSIKIEDESAKISLRQVDQLKLNILFEELQIPLSDAEILTDSLLDWIDEDDLTRLNGAEKEFYKSAEAPYEPANDHIRSWEEFRLIRDFSEFFFDENGFPNSTFKQFQSVISLYHDGPTNLNSANGLVLSVISRVDAYDTTGLFDYLTGDDGERGTSDDRLIDSRNHPFFPSGAPSRGGMADLQSQVLKVSVTVERGEVCFLTTAVVSWIGSNPGANAASAQTEPNSTRDSIERRTRTAPQTDVGTSLGYPFEIIRITENFRI